MNKVFFTLLLTCFATLSLAQNSYPIFAEKKDSIQHAAVQVELQKRFQQRDSTGRVPMHIRTEIDSLFKIDSSLRQRIIGFRTTFKPDANFTSLDNLKTGAVAPTAVKQLSISDASLRTLSREVFACTNLEELELVNTQIKKLPAKLKKNKSLTKIYIYNNSPKRALKLRRNKNIKELIIRGTEAARLPKTYKNFSSLASLDLSANVGVTAFPKISANRNLKKLNLISNQLTLAGLAERNESLEELNLQKNKIETVPSAIGNFPNLHKLTFNYNQISTVDNGISKLKKLEEVSFYQNKLQAIPDGIMQLSNLKTIDLYYNEITKITDDIAKMKGLEILYLSNNQISALPESMGELSNLRELYVHNNKLSFLPENIIKLEEMRILRLNNNYFTSFPARVLQLRELENLDISYNNLREFPKEFINLKKLQILVLLNNPWENKMQLAETTQELSKHGTLIHIDSEFVESESETEQ